MAHQLPDLPYPTNALEPHIDARTMEIHHGKHHQKYVDKLNAALEGHSDLQKLGIEDLLSDFHRIPEQIQTAVRNHGGGHANHSLFWQIMSPDGGGEPDGELADAITSEWGSFSDFQEDFTDAATGRFGSGWAWLGVRLGDGLCVCSTPNQDNPLMRDLVESPCRPILGIDVWEHAYYLHYQNRRPDYIKAWWHVVNWKRVAELYEAARTGQAALT